MFALRQTVRHMDDFPGADTTRRRSTTRTLSDLVRDLIGSDMDARDEATEELGRRLRTDNTNRIGLYLQAVVVPPDSDTATRLARLSEIRSTMQRLGAADTRTKELRARMRILKRRVDAWERYEEEAEPGTATGGWIVENLGSIDRLMSLFRARIDQIEAERDALEDSMREDHARLDEMPGATRSTEAF